MGAGGGGARQRTPAPGPGGAAQLVGGAAPPASTGDAARRQARHEVHRAGGAPSSGPAAPGAAPARVRPRRPRRATGSFHRSAAMKWNLIKKHEEDRKSTRLNSSHQIISYAVFCLKKK